MDWLSKLEELANRMIPDEDRAYQAERGSDDQDDRMAIDPLLDDYGGGGGFEGLEDGDEYEDEAPDSLQDFVVEASAASSRSNVIAPETSILSEQSTGDATTEQKRDDKMEEENLDVNNDTFSREVSSKVENPTSPSTTSAPSPSVTLLSRTADPEITITPESRLSNNQASTLQLGRLRQVSSTPLSVYKAPSDRGAARLHQITTPATTVSATEKDKQPETPLFVTSSASFSQSEQRKSNNSEKTAIARKLKDSLPPSNIKLLDREDDDYDDDDSVSSDFDFHVELPLPEWNNINDSDNSKGSKTNTSSLINCLGVVHVRVLAAQRLPCPIGSTVQCAISLLPWKGKVRSEPTVAFSAATIPNNKKNEEHLHDSVCVRWDSLEKGCSMVHAWNNEDTPIPTIAIELMFRPIAFLLEFCISVAELSCEPLMRDPGVYRKQWVSSSVPKDDRPSNHHFSDDHGPPLLLVEAAFFPSQDDDEEEEEPSDDHHQQTMTTDGASTAMSSSHPSILNKSRHTKASHLLKLQKSFFWTRPWRCPVCERFRTSRAYYRCEACHVDCCSDCQLQIDLQIPCGSTMAQAIVKRSLRHKLTLDQVMTAVAPIDEVYEEKAKNQKLDMMLQERGNSATNDSGESNFLRENSNNGVGNVHVQVHRACIFTKPLPMETGLDTVLEYDQTATIGDYYVRVSCKGQLDSKRTRTVQNTGKPSFDSPEMTFTLPHYGMEYRVDVVDADSNKSVGMTILTAQTLLQLQRDEMVRVNGLAAFVPHLRRQGTSLRQRLTLELRTGFKDGFVSSDYFATAKARSKKRNGATNPGAISGWITMDVCLEEDCQKLYGQSPVPCALRPPNELDMELLQLHIGRIGIILADMKRGVELLSFIVSWKNKPLTVSSLIGFLWFCFRFNVEYIGCLPLFFLLLMMIHLAGIRITGHLKDRFIERERINRIKLEDETPVDRSVHRPVGKVQISVSKGRNLRSRDLGLVGRVGCHVFWDPLRYCINDDEIKQLGSSDKVLKAQHDIGNTNYVYTSNPVWNQMKMSEDIRRLQQIMPTESIFGDMETNSTDIDDTETLSLPLLQPIEIINTGKENADGLQCQDKVSLVAWEKASGAIVIQVRFMDVINMLPGFEDVLGEVVLPLSRLMEKGEYNGWFQVLPTGSTHMVRCHESMDNETPHILVSLNWNPPNSDEEVSDAEREASIVLAEELVRGAERNSRNRLDIIGSSIGAFNTVRGISGNVQTIQNTLGSVVDGLETLRNLVNFTDPHLSSLVFCALLCLWLFLSVVPTRLLVCVGGVTPYITSFLALLSPTQTVKSAVEKDQLLVKKEGSKDSASPVITWLTNALQSIPTDEDLRKAYFWESARIGEIQSSKVAAKKRIARLEQLWNAKWFSTVKMKVANSKRRSKSLRSWHWDNKFAVVHGRRLLIWDSETDFDKGDPPVDRVALSGHAGLAGLSPLEMRELTMDEVPCVTNIFGRGSVQQLKLMLLAPTQAIKEALEEAVLLASHKEE